MGQTRTHPDLLFAGPVPPLALTASPVPLTTTGCPLEGVPHVCCCAGDHVMLLDLTTLLPIPQAWPSSLPVATILGWSLHSVPPVIMDVPLLWIALLNTSVHSDTGQVPRSHNDLQECGGPPDSRASVPIAPDSWEKQLFVSTHGFLLCRCRHGSEGEAG